VQSPTIRNPRGNLYGRNLCANGSKVEGELQREEREFRIAKNLRLRQKTLS